MYIWQNLEERKSSNKSQRGSLQVIPAQGSPPIWPFLCFGYVESSSAPQLFIYVSHECRKVVRDRDIDRDIVVFLLFYVCVITGISSCRNFVFFSTLNGGFWVSCICGRILRSLNRLNKYQSGCCCIISSKNKKIIQFKEFETCFWGLQQRYGSCETLMYVFGFFLRPLLTLPFSEFPFFWQFCSCSRTMQTKYIEFKQ